jgi:hypothetical protein
MISYDVRGFLNSSFGIVLLLYAVKKSGSMYSTIGSGTASQATPQGRRHKRAEVGSFGFIVLLLYAVRNPTLLKGK